MLSGNFHRYRRTPKFSVHTSLEPTTTAYCVTNVIDVTHYVSFVINLKRHRKWKLAGFKIKMVFTFLPF